MHGAAAAVRREAPFGANRQNNPPTGRTAERVERGLSHEVLIIKPFWTGDPNRVTWNPSNARFWSAEKTRIGC